MEIFIVYSGFSIWKSPYSIEWRRSNTFAQFVVTRAFGSIISERNLRPSIVSRRRVELYCWLFFCTSPSNYWLFWSSISASTVSLGCISSKQPRNSSCLINDRSIHAVYGVVCSVGALTCFPLTSSWYSSRSLKNRAICIGSIDRRIGAVIGVISATCAWSAVSPATPDVPRSS